MPSKAQNRTPMTCPICYKTELMLGTHLHRKCMKHSSDEAIKATLAIARKNLTNVASKGLAIHYHEVSQLVCAGKCMDNLLEFLSGRGFTILNTPPVPRSDTVRNDNSEVEMTKALETKVCEPVVKEKNKKCPHKSCQQSDDVIMEEEEEEEEEEESEEATTRDSDKENDEGTMEDKDERPEDAEKEENNARDQETLADEPKISWNNPLRKKMSEAGFYKRHSLNSELIAGFVNHLRTGLGVVRYKQEAENVARFLYFIDSKKPSLKFVDDIEETHKYFDKLLAIGNTHQTVFNYHKNVKRFVSYLKNVKCQKHKDRKTYKAVKNYLSALSVSQKRLHKGISKEIVAKKHKRIFQTVLKPDDLRTLLKVAGPTFQMVLRMAENGDTLLDSEKLTIINYLESIIVLKKMQRPGVVQNMTVNEWKERVAGKESSVVISFLEHKTATQQAATLILDKEEEKWFEIYHNLVRPTLLKTNKTIANFFISTSGERLYNVSNDVARFHTRFGLKPVSSQVVRRMSETFVSSNCRNPNETQIFSKLLAHSNITAERVYWEKTIDNMIKASLLPDRIQRELEEQASTSKAAMEDILIMGTAQDNIPPAICSKEVEFERFTGKYPLTVEKDPPALKRCNAESTIHGQHLYDRWRKLQNRMRVDYIIGLLQDHLPEEEKIKRTLGHQLWGKNRPRVKDILDQWKKK
ncbi:uncharacterized protein LOC142699023 [Rhinoderma darwinii]|uniref:uncharacterized protein LOC142699023 n=1 Tax=Rhinoderma darwinii TaxID=43563 RepID=UPI003F67CFA3